jgi:DNA-binding NarL/FixJ family response regulator
MSSDDRRLVLVVDDDQAVVDGLRAAAGHHRTLGALDLADAGEIVVGGQVDVLVLGPSFAHHRSIADAADLRIADPSLEIVLVAEIVTNRLLRVALRCGVDDVVDLPLDADEFAAALAPTRARRRGGSEEPIELEFVVEPTGRTGPVPHHPSQYVPESRPEQGPDTPTAVRLATSEGNDRPRLHGVGG